MRTIMLVALGATMLYWTSLVRVASGQEVSPRIINGQPTDEFPSVGIVGSQDLGGFCTGTLITRWHVLTVAHCAEVALAVDEITDEVDETRGTFEIDGQIYTTSRIHVHPDYDDIFLDNDIAILELSEPVDVDDDVPSPIFRGEPVVGDELTLVGFGLGGDEGGTFDDATFGQKMVGTTEIDAVEPTQIIWIFEEGESNSAAGDSGGPGFLLVGDTYYIASLVSYGTISDSSLGDEAHNTRVDPFADWIDGVVLGDGDDGDGDDGAGDGDGGDEDGDEGDGDDGGDGDGGDGDDGAGDGDGGDEDEDEGNGEQPGDETDCPPAHRPVGFRPGGRRPGSFRPDGMNRPASFRPGSGRRPGYSVSVGDRRPGASSVRWPSKVSETRSSVSRRRSAGRGRQANVGKKLTGSVLRSAARRQH